MSVLLLQEKPEKETVEEKDEVSDVDSEDCLKMVLEMQKRDERFREGETVLSESNLKAFSSGSATPHCSQPSTPVPTLSARKRTAVPTDVKVSPNNSKARRANANAKAKSGNASLSRAASQGADSHHPMPSPRASSTAADGADLTVPPVDAPGSTPGQAEKKRKKKAAQAQPENGAEEEEEEEQETAASVEAAAKAAGRKVMRQPAFNLCIDIIDPEDMDILAADGGALFVRPTKTKTCPTKWAAMVKALDQPRRLLHNLLTGNEKVKDQELKSSATNLKRSITTKVKKAGLNQSDTATLSEKVKNLVTLMDSLRAFRTKVCATRPGLLEPSELETDIQAILSLWETMGMEVQVQHPNSNADPVTVIGKYVAFPDLWVQAWLSSGLSFFPVSPVLPVDFLI